MLNSEEKRLMHTIARQTSELEPEASSPSIVHLDTSDPTGVCEHNLPLASMCLALGSGTTPALPTHTPSTGDWFSRMAFGEARAQDTRNPNDLLLACFLACPWASSSYYQSI